MLQDYSKSLSSQKITRYSILNHLDVIFIFLLTSYILYKEIKNYNGMIHLWLNNSFIPHKMCGWREVTISLVN